MPKSCTLASQTSEQAAMTGDTRPAAPAGCAASHVTPRRAVRSPKMRSRMRAGAAVEFIGALLIEAARPRQATSTISATRPGRGDITTTRSASSTASEIEWVTNSTALRLLGPEAQQFEAHLLARQRVERAEGLVHQQHARVVQQGAADRDALLHAAGQLARQLVLEAFQPGGRQQRPRPLLGVARRRAHQAQRKGDVAQHIRPGQQRRRLEDHARSPRAAPPPPRRRA